MLTMLGSQRQFCDGKTRRETLKVGALSVLGGFGLPQLLQAEQRREHVWNGKAKSVTCLYLLGGAPWQDMYDMKPGTIGAIRLPTAELGNCGLWQVRAMMNFFGSRGTVSQFQLPLFRAA